MTLFASQWKYQAFVKVAGKRIHCGMWIREEDAAIARDRAALHFDLDAPLNYPQKSKRLGPAAPEALIAAARAQQRKRESSRYKGVYWDSRRNRWAAIVCVRKKGIQVAQFDDEKTAAQAHDYAARMLLGAAAELNFPRERQRFETLKEVRQWARTLWKQRTSSQYRGVTWLRRDEKWLAQIAVDGQHFHLGTYDNEEEAALAYNKAAKRFRGKRAILNRFD